MNYNWGIIGSGHIANEMAEALKEIGGRFYGIWSRTPENTKAFAEKYEIENVYTSVDELLADSNIQIVYIATPHNSHIEYIKKALKNGKHVLCEKAITLNSTELQEAIALAQSKNLILAEAMTIFHCPIYREIQKLIENGTLGPLKEIQVNLGSYKDYDMTNRFFNMDLAGGAMLDIGVYALSFARYFMTEKPNCVLSQMKKAPTGVDEQVNMLLQNSKNEMATVTLSLTAKMTKMGIAAFENGFVSVDNYNRTKSATVTYTFDGHEEIITDESGLSALAHEVLNMEKAVTGEENRMCLDLTSDVMDIMTCVRYEHEMYYPEEN